jgi:DNA polymerase-3 subunit epsilon
MTWRWRRRPDSFDKHWRSIDYAVVDLETTGLNLRRDAIASYGAAIIHRGRIITAESTYGLVRPDCTMSPQSITIHALRPCDLAEAPPLSEAVRALDAVLTHRVLIAHAAWIERAFLTRAFRSQGKRLRCKIIDTAALARAAGTTAAHCRGEADLEGLAMELGLPVISPHHALGDAITTAEVFLALAARLSPLGYHTARDFIDLTTADRSLHMTGTS